MTKIGVAKLLVLEDNDEDFQALEIACEDSDRAIRVTRFNRAEPLIEQVGDATIDYPSLALFDLRMPGVGGMEALEAFKSDARLCTVPCVVLSTSTNPIEVAECYRLGANAFHEKLVETPTMIARLKTILNYWLEEADLAEPARSETHAE
ncbi:response regulator [Mariniblastus fucicola]|uniref:Response regulator rcp1 n=1 Tax=Mariniblastus fucicola TaxID=980251 RepID=A0A5B9P2H4_9BACT|nr:response regulator [Mariniblastus fucicola]QEG20717.1 Response regulator rcp1 [Mariniblastus fucicola]